MLRDALEESITEGGRPSDAAGGRQPVRPSSAPPVRGKRPQPTQQQASGGKAERGAAEAGEVGDGDSSTGDSRDLRNFDELERTSFTYEEYPVAGAPGEPEWVHVPWCGTNSGDIPVLDKKKPPQPAVAAIAAVAAAVAIPSSSSTDGTQRTSADHASTGGGDESRETSKAFNGDAVEGDEERDRRTDSSTSSQRLAAAAAVEKLSSSKHTAVESPLPPGAAGVVGTAGRGNRRSTSLSLEEGQGGVGIGESTGGDRSSSVGPAGRLPRRLTAEGEIDRYDWDASKVPTRPSLSAISHVCSGSRAEKIKARNARRKTPNKKVGEY